MVSNSTGDSTSYEDKYDKYPLTGFYAVIAPMIIGSISAVSSALIIIIISRSRSKLSTIYHRIMMGMSCVDILGSVAMALASIPMPSELREGYIDYYWEGPRLGNVGTCQAQGFFFVFGLNGMFFYNAALCFYYACVIAFRMEESTVKLRVEPFLHIVPIGISLIVSTTLLALDLYNPSGHEAWCTLMGDRDFEYFGNARLIIKHITTALISLLLIFVLVCLTLVVRRVSIVHKELKALYQAAVTAEVQRAINSVHDDYSSSDDKTGNKDNESFYDDQCHVDADRTNAHRNHDSSPHSPHSPHNQTIDSNQIFTKVEEAHHNTKVVCVQAIAYVSSFFIVLSCPLLRTLVPMGDVKSALTRLQAILVPSQGFWNLVIFVSHKIYNYHRSIPAISTCEIIGRLFHNAEEPVLFSRISLIQYDKNQHRINVMLENENILENLQFSVSGSGMNVQIDDEESSRDQQLSGFDLSHRSSLKSGFHSNGIASLDDNHAAAQTTNNNDGVSFGTIDELSNQMLGSIISMSKNSYFSKPSK